MKLLGTKEIETDRLLLRKIKESDYICAYNNWCNDKEVAKYVTWDIYKDISVTKEFFRERANSYNNDIFRWIIEYKENNEVIGTIDASIKHNNYCSCEIGYALSKKYWNKGIMTEALKSVIKYMFEECDINLIYGRFLKDNIGSGKVMKKSGLRYECVLRDRFFDKDGKIQDIVVYFISKNEYFNKDNILRKYINKEIEVKIDRKLGSKHPKHNFIYPVNYGYVPNTISGDNEELDAYVLGVYEPINSFKGKVIAIIHRLNDNDDKLVLCPVDKDFNDSAIKELVMFQERFFDFIIIR